MKFKRSDGIIVEVENKDTIKRLKRDGRFQELKDEPAIKVSNDEPVAEQELSFDDLQMKAGGHYYTPDGEYFAHGENKAREKLGELDE